MKRMLKTQQSGRSMMETLGYMSVVGMITISASVAVHNGYSRYKLGRINQQLVDLKKVISQRYVASENYQAVNIDTLINEKIIPHSLDKQKHAFGGDVEIGNENDGTTFYITFSDVPLQACVELGTKLWIVNDGSDLDSMEINGHTWAWEYSNYNDTPDYKLPAKLIDVTKHCKKDDDNTLKWSFS